jgi:hypothetical protein
MSEIIRPNFDTKFVTNGDFAAELYEVVLKYDRQISAAEVIGVLEIVKHYVFQGQKESIE